MTSIFDMTFLIEQKHNWRFFSKPLIILSLIGYFYQISRPVSWTLLSKSVMGALIFSWFGDILLLSPDLFVYGIGSSFLAHVCFIIAFKIAQSRIPKIGEVNFVQTFLFNLPIYFFAAFTFYLIYPELGQLKIPMIFYIIVIVSMASTARERFKRSNPASFWQVFAGACFLFVSDAVITINKFYLAFPESGIIITGTYAIAQLLIVMGIRSHMIRPK